MSYLFTIIPFLLVIILAILLPVILLASYRHFMFGATLIIGIWLVQAIMMQVGYIQLGLQIYYTDFVLLIIGAIAGLRFLLADDYPKRHWAWTVFAVVLVISMVLGLASFGTQAGVQARNYYYFLAAGLYAMSFPMDDVRIKKLLRLLGVVAIFLVILCIYRWTVYYTPITALLPPGGAYNVDGAIRVVRSMEALLLVEMLVVGLFFYKLIQWLRFWTPMLFGAVVTLQHRSVWLAGIVGVLCSFAIGRSARSSRPIQILLIVSIAVMTALPMVFSDKLSGVANQIGSSAQRALAGKDTTAERMSSWKEIIKKWAGAGPKSILIGQSFGADMSRDVGGLGKVRKIDYQAHNMYVQTLFNTGLLGLGALLIIIFYVIRGLYKLAQSEGDNPVAEVLLVLVLMQTAYYVPYGVDFLQSFIFGVAFAYLATRKNSDLGRSDVVRKKADTALYVYRYIRE